MDKYKLARALRDIFLEASDEELYEIFVKVHYEDLATRGREAVERAISEYDELTINGERDDDR